MRYGRVSGFSEGFLYLLKACLENHRLGDISIMLASKSMLEESLWAKGSIRQ